MQTEILSHWSAGELFFFKLGISIPLNPLVFFLEISEKFDFHAKRLTRQCGGGDNPGALSGTLRGTTSNQWTIQGYCADLFLLLFQSDSEFRTVSFVYLCYLGRTTLDKGSPSHTQSTFTISAYYRRGYTRQTRQTPKFNVCWRSTPDSYHIYVTLSYFSSPVVQFQLQLP